MATQPPRTFIDDLTSYFAQKTEVQAAYFAFLFSSASETHDLFLGVEHVGGLEGIQTMTLLIKNVYLGDSPMYFASTEHDADTFAIVKEEGLLFFSRQDETAVAQQLLKLLFDKREGSEALAEAVRHNSVYALVNSAMLQEKKLAVQAFAQGETVFTPLYTHPNMLARAGMAAVPAGLALARVTWSKHLAGAPPRQVVLNPDTDFTAQFEL
ncbi:MAG TPA: enhanced serine sensitivity protein SseB C-terminal domain-containing protein [Hymenobacter sp.]|jgi:hypothetical protein|uniref:enhanced serine sensitivity protein SseB C-terminal domain-containing protein n=1 Tax=Hymenobacter sp. TaxID=1898978 RepID=UPI002ED9BEC9